MNENTPVNTADVDDLLDATLDDLEDLPSFTPFEPGAHRVAATLSMKEIGGKAVVELELTMIESLELSDPNAVPPKEGDSCSTIFMLDNEYGRGNLKKVATPIATALGTGSIRDTIEQATDVECIVITSIRKDKVDPDKVYLNIKELSVV